MGVDQFGDFSKTQRIVLLIDLNPLLYLQNPTPYLTSVLCAVKTLLSFSPLSSSSPSLFAFKLFFSSLSPLLSSSKLNCLIPGCPLSLSFNHPSSTFQSLSSIFNSILAGENPLADSLHPKLPPQASCQAASMRQLVYDYTWDPNVGDAASGLSSDNCDFLGVRSNLIVLFSQFCKSVYSLANFLNVGEEDVCLNNLDSFAKSFCGLFESVNDAFISRDIQCSWVDVRESTENSNGFNESESINEFFKSGIRSLGWGFSSTDSIILGSALVPFGLLYPRIGISSRVFDRDECSKKVQAQLSLEIIDSKGKPLECKSCDLQLVQMKTTTRPGSGDLLYNLDLLTHSSEHEKDPSKIMKLHVKAVQDHRGYEKYKVRSSEPIVVSEFLGDSGKNINENSGQFFADKVLKMLAIETSGCPPQKSFPIWQIFLSFLYKEGYFATVTISNGNENSYMGVLRPFTISSALLFIIDDEFHPPKMNNGSAGGNLDRSIESICGKPGVYSDQICGFVNSDSGPSTFVVSSQETDGKIQKGKKFTNLCLDLTWNAFCQVAYENSKLDLGEAYFSKSCKSSKKLKFLKCWMKQVKKSSFYSLNSQKSELDKIPKETEDKFIRLPHESESEEPISTSALGGGNSMVEASRILDEASPNCFLETSQSFFGDLSNKIKQGIESEAVDLGALAERLVNSSIYWLSQKKDGPDPTTSESRVSSEKSDDVYDTDDEIMLSTLTKLLLRELKDLAANHKNNNKSSSASDPGSSGLASKNLVREYELQILFRMEVLRSEVGEIVGVSVKQKFIKHICLFLETIQCQMEGGFFGDWSLEIYLDRIIKSRYSDSLGEVVHKIYEKMDLLLFVDEDEPPIHILNSEDSSHSCREKPERDEMGENHNFNDQLSTEETPLEENEYINFSLTKKEQSYKFLEAQERRDRARRFASFTSWVPDLQRVWAPKQPKPVKKKIDHRQRRKSSKRKDYENASFDMVCETPMTEKRRSCSRVSGIQDEYLTGFGDNPSRSVSKVLFKDKD